MSDIISMLHLDGLTILLSIIPLAIMGATLTLKEMKPGRLGAQGIISHPTRPIIRRGHHKGKITLHLLPSTYICQMATVGAFTERRIREKARYSTKRS